MISIRAPAKLNLRLAVLARETSGFHQIETIFCALALADAVQVGDDVDAGIHLEVDGASLGPAEENLAHRAASEFFRAIGRPARARIRLRKRIPAGAGLGGASSDAAATLMALQRLHGEPVRPEELLDIGGRLGSDVPFFLTNSQLALAWGRGQRLLALPPLPVAPVLLAVPDEVSRTPEAYEALDRRRGEDAGPAPQLLLPAAFRTWAAVAGLARNDFEPVVFDRIPVLRDVRNSFSAEGATLARLTGSGSAVFGVFPDTERRDAVAAALPDRFGELSFIATETLGARDADG